jgi:hypothetical protein
MLNFRTIQNWTRQKGNKIMTRSKGRAAVFSSLAATWLCAQGGGFCADDPAAPPINSSGQGMTSAQLDATRPVQSGKKSVEEAYQTIKEIQDKAKEIVSLCTNQVPVRTRGDDDPGPQFVGGFTKTSGKYYTASKWKLNEAVKTINRQNSALAVIVSQNQQDHRILRAREETRNKIESLRKEAREMLPAMIADTNKLTSAISASAVQSDIVDAAKALIRSCRPVEEKLKEMDKVLKRECPS